MDKTVTGVFTSEKISKIRWASTNINETCDFITGSWDNGKNNIRLWSYRLNEEDSDIYPYEVEKYTKFQGDVTELKFISDNTFAVSFSSGTVELLKIIAPSNKIRSIRSWNNLHHFKSGDRCSCSALSLYDEDIVTVGEDGALNLLTAKQDSVVRSFDADSCSIQCVSFLKYNEVLTGNIRGQMKIWDLRSDENFPTNTFMLSGDQISATCLAFHPTQRHLVLAGDEEGTVTVWDLRQNSFPVTLLSAHTSTVAEMQFHANYPNHLFSCSADGELWHWNTTGPSRSAYLGLNLEMEQINPWMSAEGVKSKLDVATVMPNLHKPINSIDMNGNKLICGADNEAFYFINNLNVY